MAMKSYLAKDPGSARSWALIDVEGRPLGRVATRIADILRGKHRPTFTPHVDAGEFVVVVNADKVKLTGRKETQKLYQRYSGYRDGLKKIPASVVRQHHPDRLIRLAVKGMLPHNTLSRKLETRLKVYAGPDHPHAAQNPRKVDLGKIASRALRTRPRRAGRE